MPVGNLQNDRSQRAALESLLDGTSSSLAAKQDATIAAGRLGTGSVARSVEDRARDVRSIKDFGAKGDGTTVDDDAMALAVLRAAEDGFDLYAPPTGDFYRLTRPVYWRSGVHMNGAGYHSTFKNTRTNTSDVLGYGQHFCFVLGNMDGGGFTGATFYQVADRTMGNDLLTMSNAGDESHFTEGEICWIRNNVGLLVAGDLRPTYQQINEILSIDTNAHTIKLKYPLYKDLSGGRIASNSTSSRTDPLGVAGKCIRDWSLSNLRIVSSVERWTGWGGSLRGNLHDLWIEADGALKVNGFAHGSMSRIHSLWSSALFELAYFSHDSSFYDVESQWFASSGYTSALTMCEHAHHLSFRDMGIFPRDGWRGDQGIFFNSVTDCVADNIAFRALVPSTATVSAVTMSTPSDADAICQRNVARGIKSHIANMNYHIKIADGANAGLVKDNRIEGGTYLGSPSAGGMTIGGVRNRLINVAYEGGDIALTSAGSDTRINGCTRLDGDLVVADSSLLSRVDGTVRLVLDDDTVHSFKVPTIRGTLEIMYANSAAAYAVIIYKTDSPGGTSIHAGSTNYTVSTGVLTNGTSDGTDGKMCVNIHTDGRVYLKNRTGGQLTIRYRVAG